MASLDGSEYALPDFGFGLASFPINFADDPPLMPRHDNIQTLSNATGGSVECIGQRQVSLLLTKRRASGGDLACLECDELDHLH